MYINNEIIPFLYNIEQNSLLSDTFYFIVHYRSHKMPVKYSNKLNNILLYFCIKFNL